jgi:hypothetical protein
MFDLRAMLLPLPPWPWKTNTSGAWRDGSPGTSMTAVRVVPPTSKDASWRPGVYAPSDVELAAGAVDGDGAEDGSAEELPELELPDEHPDASAPMTATTPMATP